MSLAVSALAHGEDVIRITFGLAKSLESDIRFLPVFAPRDTER